MGARRELPLWLATGHQEAKCRNKRMGEVGTGSQKSTVENVNRVGRMEGITHADGMVGNEWCMRSMVMSRQGGWEMACPL